MNTRRRVIRAGGQRLTSDMMMGIAGCGLAMASTSFGIFMTIRGPAPDFGTSHDFTVFAQLAPRASRGPRGMGATPKPGDDLDMTSTASIPRDVGATAEAASSERAADILASATVEVATDDAATVAIGGHVRTIHVGDTLPDVGAVLSITPGRRPSVRTTSGVIFAARND